MNRVELSNVVAQVTGNTKKSVDEIISTAFDAIKEAVARGEDVTIAKFGVFKQTVRPARLRKARLKALNSRFLPASKTQ